MTQIDGAKVEGFELGKMIINDLEVLTGRLTFLSV